MFEEQEEFESTNRRKKRSNTKKQPPQQFSDLFKPYEPLNVPQEHVERFFNKDYNLIMYGYPGTGKTAFILNLVLNALLTKKVDQKKIVLIRSTVPTREQGYLPGGPKEKASIYERPYVKMCNEMFTKGDMYGQLKTKDVIEFESTSYLRGDTIDDAFIIVDEFQNMHDEEAHTVITRAGENSRLFLCGDTSQNDLKYTRHQSCARDIIRICDNMDSFRAVQFNSIDDIIRSGLVREYIITRIKLEEMGHVSQLIT